MHTKPPIKTALTLNYPAPVTKNGAAIFPRLDIASDIPVPVDFIYVGKLYVVIRLNKAKPTY
jgi:hypothetical protein